MTGNRFENVIAVRTRGYRRLNGTHDRPSRMACASCHAAGRLAELQQRSGNPGDPGIREFRSLSHAFDNSASTTPESYRLRFEVGSLVNGAVVVPESSCALALGTVASLLAVIRVAGRCGVRRAAAGVIKLGAHWSTELICRDGDLPSIACGHAG